ncbi:hypothetical protein MHN01_07170, partial [Photobacterium sp. OFAV2-7]
SAELPAFNTFDKFSKAYTTCASKLFIPTNCPCSLIAVWPEIKSKLPTYIPCDRLKASYGSGVIFICCKVIAFLLMARQKIMKAVLQALL